MTRWLRPLYPLVLDVTYDVLDEGRVIAQGSGQTRMISSTDIILEGSALPIGKNIRLVLNWPAVLNESAGLVLVIRGQTGVSWEGFVFIQVLAHFFRVRPIRRSLAAGAGMQIVANRNAHCAIPFSKRA